MSSRPIERLAHHALRGEVWVSVTGGVVQEYYAPRSSRLFTTLPPLRRFVEQLMTSRLGNPTLGPGTAVANGHCDP